MEGKADEFKKPSVSPKGDEIENRGKQLDQLLGVITFVGIIVNLYFVPLRLRETYLTEGFSRGFVHYVLGAFCLIIIYGATMFKMIGHHLFMVLMIPAMIGFLATYDLITVCIGMVLGLVVSIIIFSVVMIFDKNGDVKDNTPLPADATEV